MFTTIQDDLNPVEILTNVLQYLTSNYGGSMAAHIVSIALRQVKEDFCSKPVIGEYSDW